MKRIQIGATIQPLRLNNSLDLAGNKGGTGADILLVVGVLRGDDGGAIADLVARVADDLDLGGGDGADGVAVVRVAKDED